MAKTVAQLAARVLERIGILAAGDTPTPFESTRVTDFYADQYQELEVRGIAYWDETDIPNSVFQALADYLAGLLSSDDGWPRPDLIADGERRLNLMSAEPASGEVQQAEYF